MPSRRPRRGRRLDGSSCAKSATDLSPSASLPRALPARRTSACRLALRVVARIVATGRLHDGTGDEDLAGSGISRRCVTPSHEVMWLLTCSS